MINFEFQNKTRIVFGRAAEEKVGPLTKAIGSKVLLHYGGGSIKRSGLYDTIMKSLASACIEVVELGGVVSNPRVSLVREGIELCRKEDIEMILAVGGGSVIDSAKGIAAGVYHDGDVWELYTGDKDFEKCLPIGVVLTIPAAGSESSAGSVVTNEEGNWKKDIIHNNLRPAFAVLNPELTFTLSNYQTACGVTDMLAHVMERYFTMTEDVALTDALCEAVMRTIIKMGPIALVEPSNYAVRAELMWSATLAHNDLVGTGRVGDWSSHMIEHELSGLYDIAHGAGLAIIFPAWMKYVYKENIPRFVQFANRVFEIEINPYDLEETALKGIEALERFYRHIGMPINFTQAGLPTDGLETMAMKATHQGNISIGGFKRLSYFDVLEILKLAT